MKRIILVVFSIVLLTSCGNNNTNFNQVESTLDKVIKEKKLRVGYFIFEPTIMKSSESGNLEGIFIDMIEKIAKSISPDVQVIYQETKLSDFSVGLNSKQFDLCIGATFATPQRATSVLFTSPLFYCGYTGVVLQKDSAKYTDWSEINTKNVKTAVLNGSAIADLMRTDFLNANIAGFPGSDLTIPLAAVSSGQADVGLMNEVTVRTYLREHPELIEIFKDKPIAATYFSWSVRPDDIKWVNYLNTCIEYLQNTGEMLRYENKYNVPLRHRKEEFIIHSK